MAVERDDIPRLRVGAAAAHRHLRDHPGHRARPLTLDPRSDQIGREIIETERLRIGPLAALERDVLAAMWLDPHNARLHPGHTEEQVRRWMEDVWGVWERATDELVGDCTLFFSDDHGEWELAYGLRRDRWGRGYATEAAQACVLHGFEHLGLQRIVADVDRENSASIHVLEKCGFVRAGGTDAHPVYALSR